MRLASLSVGRAARSSPPDATTPIVDLSARRDPEPRHRRRQLSSPRVADWPRSRATPGPGERPADVVDPGRPPRGSPVVPATAQAALPRPQLTSTHAAEAGLPVPGGARRLRPRGLLPHRPRHEPMVRPTRVRRCSTTRWSWPSSSAAAAAASTGGRPPSITSLATPSSTTAASATTRSARRQWMLGKNFHGTGALGPELVTARRPARTGRAGLRHDHPRSATTLLQDSNTDIDDLRRRPGHLPALGARSAFEPGDVIAMGTPPG